MGASSPPESGPPSGLAGVLASRRKRLTALLVLAGVAAAAAVATNLSYWRQVAVRRRAVQGAPYDPRPAQARSLQIYLERNPGDTGRRLRLADLYQELGDHSAALAQLEILRRAGRDDPELLLRKAAVLRAAGRLEAAEGTARRLLALQPESSAARLLLGEVLLDQGQHHDALELFDACLKERPESFPALLGKGRAMEELLYTRHPISLPEMTATMEKAASLAPDDPVAVLIFARMNLAYLRKPDEAERLAQHAARLVPDNAGPYILLAEVALSRPPTKENLDRAGEYAFQAGRRDLNDPRPPQQVGRVALLHNDIPRAIRALERSLQLGPTPEAVSQLATAYQRAGDADRAARYSRVFQRYTDLLERRNSLLSGLYRNTRDPARYHALAELYLEAGQPADAEQWLQEAKRFRRGDRRGAQLLVRVERQRKKQTEPPLLPIP